MTYKEIVEAMKYKRPVLAFVPLLGNLRYAYVSAMVYRCNEKGEFVMAVEISDYNNRSVTIISPKQLTFAPEGCTGNLKQAKFRG